MYIKKIYGYVISKNDVFYLEKGLLDYYDPPKQTSRNYENWIAILDIKTCLYCRSRHGQVYLKDEIPDEKPPVHPFCRCEIKSMEAVIAGYATKDGQNGADWWMKYAGGLPGYYITANELEQLGWKWGKAPAKFAPGRMFTKGIYRNEDEHLPQVLGRIWFEADINYYSGRRNKHRLLWSDDGLLFVTYDHYQTFLEII